MRVYSLLALSFVLSIHVFADVSSTNVPARAILDKVLANRAMKDFSLKARLFAESADPVMVDIWVKNTTEDTRTVYKSGATEALIVQPVKGEPHFYLKGVGELTGDRRSERLLGSEFSYYDLGLAFLRWPNAKLVSVDDRVRGRDCFTIESMADGEPYPKVKIYIDKEYYALLRAEAYNKDGDLTRRFAVTSFRKVGDAWIPRGLEASILPPGQALPNEKKSRLEIFEGNYDTKLKPEQFSVEAFGPTPAVK